MLGLLISWLRRDGSEKLKDLSGVLRLVTHETGSSYDQCSGLPRTEKFPRTWDFQVGAKQNSC